jgi:hypothetical protein
MLRTSPQPGGWFPSTSQQWIPHPIRTISPMADPDKGSKVIETDNVNVFTHFETADATLDHLAS